MAYWLGKTERVQGDRGGGKDITTPPNEPPYEPVPEDGGGDTTKPDNDCVAACREARRAERERIRSLPIRQRQAATDAMNAEYQRCVSACGDGDGGETTEGDGVDTMNGQCPKGKYYTHFPSEGPCAEGYVLQPRAGKGWDGYQPGADGRCECVAWCLSLGCDENCKNCDKDKASGLGEFTLPDNLMSLFDRLIQRAAGALDMPLGYSDEAINAMFGKDFENIRARQPAIRESLINTLGREGQLGTGTALKALSNVGWMTEKNISDLARDLFITSEEKKKQDYLDYSNLASSIFGGGLQVPSMIEVLNAARRGERQSAIQMLLDLYMAMGG